MNSVLATEQLKDFDDSQRILLKEAIRVVNVIADQVEAGNLAHTGIYRNVELAAKIRMVTSFAQAELSVSQLER